MTKRTLWKHKAYFAWKETFQWHVFKHPMPREGLEVVFLLPMPPSWSLKKHRAMRGTRHMQKPDLSNLLKALEDAWLPDHDQEVSSVHAEKFWWESGAICWRTRPVPIMWPYGER